MPELIDFVIAQLDMLVIAGKVLLGVVITAAALTLFAIMMVGTKSQ